MPEKKRVVVDRRWLFYSAAVVRLIQMLVFCSSNSGCLPFSRYPLRAPVTFTQANTIFSRPFHYLPTEIFLSKKHNFANFVLTNYNAGVSVLIIEMQCKLEYDAKTVFHSKVSGIISIQHWAKLSNLKQVHTTFEFYNYLYSLLSFQTQLEPDQYIGSCNHGYV